VKAAQHLVRLRLVSSRQNALLKDLRRSFRRSEPTEDGFCAIEGVKMIEEAIRSRLRLRAVVFSDSGLSRADRLLPQLKAQIAAIRISDEDFRSVVETEAPQGVAALVAFPGFTLEQMLAKADPLLVVAHAIQDPGNLGTIMRSAAAFGADGLLLSGQTVSRFNAKVVRASAGSVFRLPCTASKWADLSPALKGRGIRMIGTSSHKGTAAQQANLCGAVALVVGNEGAGLPQQIMTTLDEMITIPHAAAVESLNAGIAASILLYEAARQRSQA
jgi:RNA methyltransferase, TrmH family